MAETEDTRTERLLPQDVNAEMYVIGAMIAFPDCIRDVLAIVKPDDFYRDAHRIICAAIFDLYAAHHPVDTLAIFDLLEKREQVEAANGISYVDSLGTRVETPRSATYHAERVHDKAVARRVIALGASIARVGYEEGDIAEALDTSRALLETFALRTGGMDSTTLADGIDAYLAHVDAVVRGEAQVGIASGLDVLDEHLTGFKPGELIYMAGRPGSGKSALAAMIIQHNATMGKHIEWVTLEMSKEQQAQRLISAAAEVNGRIMRADFRRPDGSIDRFHYGLVLETALRLREEIGERIHIEDHPVRMRDLFTRMSRAVLDKGRDLIVLDYLGLIDGDDPRQNDYQRVSAISRDLKRMAMELHVPVICLVQLNREVEKRADKRPMLSDLRDSGGLEQDADVVLGIYRGAYYDTERARTDERFAQLGELLVLKARASEANVALPFRWEGEYTRPSNWPDEWDWKAYTHKGGNGNDE